MALRVQCPCELCAQLTDAASCCSCAAQFTFLQDDVGIPKNYRHMEGFGVHTYTLINKAGRVTYVKFHWQPACGARPCCILTRRPACSMLLSQV